MRRHARFYTAVGWRGATYAGLALVLVAAVGTLRAADDGVTPSGWQLLEPGLEFGTFIAPQPAGTGDSRIRVLRLDPERFELQLLNASAVEDGVRQTPKEWASRHDLVAVINASLYQTDYRTSVSLMKTRTHTNNPRLSRDNAVLAFDRIEDRLPPVQIIDRTCQDFADLRSRYGTLVQSIRMVSCRGKNVWSQQPDKWSTAAIGIDQLEHVLFIHVRSPYSTHDLINHLLALPLRLKNAMYVEGGPQAQLYLRAGGREIEFVGSHGSRMVNDGNLQAIPIPNVIGARHIAEHREQSE